ncbi:hypothetical protein [Serratia quinivorans]|uniref:hypothetical protein n=1 Tax=Serratia quinivorans TaxID=137545 RepID=UPI002178A3FB|nr:hypothetical protein [Serratia quinivorans]CAI0846062.1 Uncharacterised protein [Serratia quinivorans]CAI1601748.1 Uncharacterised protein [Serratia quinivorans]
MNIGIYCTVSTKEFPLAMATLHFAETSDYVSNIVVLITDGAQSDIKKITEKITVYTENFGAGYSISIENGGYNQISARNFLIEKLENTESEWLMMHDADDLYDLDFYRFISEECMNFDAVTCSCFSLRWAYGGEIELSVPILKSIHLMNGHKFHDPHTRVWKKALNLRYEKSSGIENHFSNHSRHCGVIFPFDFKVACTDSAYHFHLHALLNKRHSGKINDFTRIDYILSVQIRYFIEINNEFFA